MTYKKKLIEVALPLEAINIASAREKSIRHGHPSTLHLWWARRPLAAARAVIFAQMVDDPSAHPDIFPTEKKQEKERQRLFRIIEDLVQWENTTNEVVLQQARDEIWQSWRYICAENADHSRAKELFDRHKLPAFHDPFAGGEGTTNTGWDTFLAAVFEAGLAISGTWPIRTEMKTRQIAMGTNALASSIVLVCRKRATNEATATRREFIAALKTELPQALAHLQAGNIAPVDLAQAAIGPGMAVYTRYAKVLDAEGKALLVREALSLINQVL